MLLAIILFSCNAMAGNKKVIINIEQMNCSLCVISINKALRSTEGVIKAKSSLKTHQAEVIVPDDFDVDKLLVSISHTGYLGAIETVTDLTE